MAPWMPDATLFHTVFVLFDLKKNLEKKGNKFKIFC